ncbi:sensor histidine kinase [Devosia sp.]|uniref:sensor histidine kinase n=1 Tax=Devosia sp. TaxID=1871048 RepID=UPI003A92F61D
MNTHDIWTHVGALQPPDFLAEGGRMAREITDYDWSRTSIGQLADWPAALRSVVQMALLSRQPICLFWGRDLNLIYNDDYAPFLGKKEAGALGQPFEQIWSDVWDDVAPVVIEALSGKGTWVEDMPLVMTRNGVEEQTYWSYSYSPLYDDAGKVAGLIDIATETTAAVEARHELTRSAEEARRQLELQHKLDEQHRVIHREMMHRMKNIFSMTKAVVSQTLRHADSLAEANETVSQRISALANAQDVLTNVRSSSTGLRAMVSQALKPHQENGRITVEGPETMIPSQNALGVALAIHELATNATKYGALSNDTGRVRLSWAVDADSGFTMEWREQGGPPVAPPTRNGFGSQLMRRIVPSYFSGVGETRFAEDGLHYVLTGSISLPPETGAQAGATA